MDRLEAMSLLIEVVDRGGFSAAGRSLRVPVTTISRKISDLEEAVGAKLLIRTTRKVDLTEAGVNYVRAARRIIDQVEEAQREAAGEFTVPKGDLVITAPVQFGQLHVLPVVSDFLALFPQINIRLLLLDRHVHLVEDHVDMAVRIGKLPDSAMIATGIGSMRTVVCASPHLLAGHGLPQTPSDLVKLPCVTFEGPMPSSSWPLRNPRTGASIDIPIVSRLSVTTAGAAVAAAIRHVGATRLLHYQVAEAVKAGTLQLVLEEYEPEPTPVSLVHAARGQMALKMRRFLDFATPQLRTILLELQDKANTAADQDLGLSPPTGRVESDGQHQLLSTPPPISSLISDEI